jgi:hypothetical protein
MKKRDTTILTADFLKRYNKLKESYSDELYMSIVEDLLKEGIRPLNIVGLTFYVDRLIYEYELSRKTK